ncbi:hypothetical protein KIN20_038209 [Parelaphostrongylus tenuis]|uniref:Uncharacterized protein n=1 Tax=Parelaphostrongylus tenuis TaxID=148309 RepID=A0AAD5RFM8_PARTN|nr:hypothetical protein KIN20_038209 [Parelaphostrongylus tenuis]
MSRVGDPSYHKLIASPICSFNSLMVQTCTPSIPSTATISHIPGDLTSSLACSLLTCTIPSAAMISPPPPYHSISHHNIHRRLFDMHNTNTIGEVDMDVMGLSQSTKEVSICDKDVSNDQGDKPLDLSLKNSTSLYSPTTSRPSVIIESPSGRNPSVRRSASSVSSSREHDVHEHFRRSLSGKWPRRSKIDDEKTRASPITRRTSFNTHGSTCTQQPHVIVSNSGVDIADHFRRALSEKEFDNWQRKRNAKPSTSK